MQVSIFTYKDRVQKKRNKMAYRAKDPHPPPPRRFLYLRETKSWRWEGGGEEGEGEKVSLLTHATARGVGKKKIIPQK